MDMHLEVGPDSGADAVDSSGQLPEPLVLRHSQTDVRDQHAPELRISLGSGNEVSWPRTIVTPL